MKLVALFGGTSPFVLTRSIPLDQSILQQKVFMQRPYPPKAAQAIT